MTDNATREVTPLQLAYRIEYEQAELEAVFASDDPTRQALFFSIYSNKWDGLKKSERLRLLAEVAQLAEATEVQLNLKVGTPVPKK